MPRRAWKPTFTSNHWAMAACWRPELPGSMT